MLSKRRVRTLPLATAAVCLACDAAPLVAPTQSTMTLVAGAAIVPAGGSTEVTARVVEAAGTPVHDGTVVSFSATLGRIDPPEVATVGGRAAAKFTAGAASGVADLRAYSGEAAAGPVQVTIGAAAVASLRVTARPGSLPPSGGESALTATVFDSARNPLPGVPVAFSADAGVLREVAATSDDAGAARTVLVTSTTATVTASAGDGIEAAATVAVDPVTAITVTSAPETPVAWQTVTFTVELRNETHAIRAAGIAFGDGRSQDLGATARAVVSHAYREPGTYTVTVQATDAAGHAVSASTAVRVDPAPGLGVTVSASPAEPVIGRSVTFTVTVSRPANGPSVEGVTIDFGDGSRQSLGALTGSRTVARVYRRAGTYVARVTARDTAGRRSEASTGVTVSAAAALGVTVSASPPEPVAGRPVTFTVTVSPPANGPPVRAVTIDFGDRVRQSLGALAGSRTVAHVYKRAGAYVVEVTASDTAGRRSEASIGVTVSAVSDD